MGHAIDKIEWWLTEERGLSACQAIRECTKLRLAKRRRRGRELERERLAKKSDL